MRFTLVTASYAYFDAPDGHAGLLGSPGLNGPACPHDKKIFPLDDFSFAFRLGRPYKGFILSEGPTGLMSKKLATSATVACFR